MNFNLPNLSSILMDYLLIFHLKTIAKYLRAATTLDTTAHTHHIPFQFSVLHQHVQSRQTWNEQKS
ncbi:CLUMA_CG006072, isoform A [Clunio marinus]|uniref:CLUMA_CG006072, isoform A n=1 Tax=Clunio marinus TaxID=568069 RepID=A0A1J1HX32_9DIPT|nr:CLUMA_CG006072, isoform A [Clunio marinus]